MAYEAKIYRILIASPLDVEAEREIAVRVIQEWNDLHSYSRKIVLLPLRWETHVAPEYGVRPQEIINKTIVDQCDLVVGIFWTRLGSPTGEFESGTIEEIQRAAKLGKPVMLYFSQREVQLEKIDINQLERLRKFKKEVYSIALVETYNSIYEFKEKFAKSLEIKIKELHERNERDEIFFKFGIFSIEDEIIKSQYIWEIDCPKIIDIDRLSKNKRERLKKLIDWYIDRYSYCPLLFAIKNLTSVSLQDLYIELEIFSESKNLNITDSIQEAYYLANIGSYFPTVYWEVGPVYTIPTSHIVYESSCVTHHPIVKKINDIFSKYKPTKLYKKENSWKICFELNVLQPQRLQILEPALYVKTIESNSISIKSKIYTDLFPRPYEFDLKLEIKVTYKQIKYENLDSTWIEYIEKNE